jgi:hypothetical protein
LSPHGIPVATAVVAVATLASAAPSSRALHHLDAGDLFDDRE